MGLKRAFERAAVSAARLELGTVCIGWFLLAALGAAESLGGGIASEAWRGVSEADRGGREPATWVQMDRGYDGLNRGFGLSERLEIAGRGFVVATVAAGCCEFRVASWAAHGHGLLRSVVQR
jgi:hypothetical protein